MNIGKIFIDVMAQITDISGELAEWEQQIEKIASRANGWLTFASVCGWIGLVLSLIAFAILITNRKEGGKHGKN